MSDLCCPSSYVKVYTYSYCLGKSMTTMFPLLHELTNMPFGYSKFPQHSHMEKGARFQSLLYISSAIPNEQGRLKRQNVTFFLKSLLRVLPLWSDNRPPMESSLLSEPAFTYLRIPSKGALPSGSPRSEWCSASRAPFVRLLKSPVNDPPLVERGTHFQTLTLHILQGSQKGALLQGSPRKAPIGRLSVSRAVLHVSLKAPLQVPWQGCYW